MMVRVKRVGFVGPLGQPLHEPPVGQKCARVEREHSRELGVAMTTYGALSRGLLSGAKPAGRGDVRAHLPRFAAGNAEKHRPLVDALARFAADKGVSPAQLALAWVRAKGAAQNVTIVPTLGARTRKQLAEALSSLDVSRAKRRPARAGGGRARGPAAARAALDRRPGA